MSFDDPAEERRLQYQARAEEALARAQEARDAEIRDWWLSAAEAWQFLADSPHKSGGSTR